MNDDFHYYGTYCAATLAGYSPEQSEAICYSSQLVDHCTKTFLQRIKGPLSAATTQKQLELANAPTDPVGLQDITRIWSSFHFLPYDLYADVARGGKRYREKYHLICDVNGNLVIDTIELAKGRSLQAAGIAMHVLADTWAHRYFAGTPSLVINNVSRHTVELLDKDGKSERPFRFGHNPSVPDDPSSSKYVSSVYHTSENSIMNLGHGRAGHLPDYSYARYRYLPAWANYEEVIKDNPHDHWHAFAQMVYALRFLRGDYSEFELNQYDWNTVEAYREPIQAMFERRQLSDADDWKSIAKDISGSAPQGFSLEVHISEYTNAPASERADTFLGRFIIAALSQKSMVTNRIFSSGNILAGRSIDFNDHGFGGIRDYLELIRHYGSDTSNTRRVKA